MVNNNLALNHNDSEKTSPKKVQVKQDPLKWCSVSLSNVVARGERLDASVYDTEAIKIRNLLNDGKYPLVPIVGSSGLATAYTCGRFKRIWVNHSDYPIYQPSTMLNIKPKPDGYLSKSTKTDIEALRVHRGQVLLTCSGTIGNISYVSKTLDNCIFSHDLMRIDSKRNNDAGYIYAYLKTAVGNKMLLTNKYGAVVTHIEAKHLASVPIPNAPENIKDKINELIVHSFELRDESNDLLDQANDLLIKELKLPPLEEFKQNAAYYQKDAPVDTFSVKLSNLNNRLDGSYHVPVVNAIIEHLKQYSAELTTVGDPKISKEIILPGRFKRVYVDEGHGKVFIGGKQLWELDPSNKKYLSITYHADRIKKQLELHENMTLITCSGTIGKVALVGKHWEGWTANQHIIRVIPASKDIAGFLNVFLSSDYGHELITRYTYGSVVDEINDNHVSQIAFPLLKNQEIQAEINRLALEANAKRYEAYTLEQKALNKMNDEVIYAK
jgi:type I restriction enzyme S subunit